MENKIVKGYKALNMDMSSAYGNMEYEVGKQYHLDGGLMFCENGYHFCEKMINITAFYNVDNSRIFEIEASGDIIKNGIKSCTNNICLIRELSENEIARIVNESYNDESLGIKTAIARSKYTNDEILDILSEDESLYVRCGVAQSLTVNAKILERLSDDEIWHVRCAVAGNPNTGIKILEKLSNDNNWKVICAVAENKKKRSS